MNDRMHHIGEDGAEAVIYTTITKARVITEILRELRRARELHPQWPVDRIHQAAIVCEEAGEALQAALNHRYHSGSPDEIRKELVQTGAMVIRMLVCMAD